MRGTVLLQQVLKLCVSETNSMAFRQYSYCRRFASTHFGFQSVDEKEKGEKVYAVFANVATKYDMMNDAMSMGIHRLWKDYFVRNLPVNGDTKMLDVAGGTGDITFRALRRIQKGGGNGSITVCDINQPMLDVGAQRAAADSTVNKDRIKWICGNAEGLPFEDNSFDVYTIAFGIRNCTHVDKVLEEAHRVLRPGGMFACLEFSEITPILRPFYDFYSFRVIPIMGQVLAGDYDSYRYLVESIRKFPAQEEFTKMIRNAGFTNVAYENLSFGTCAIHKGMKNTMQT